MIARLLLLALPFLLLTDRPLCAEAASQIYPTITQLRRYPILPDKELEVPQPVARNLIVLKHVLRDVIISVVAAPNAGSETAETFERSVKDRIEAQDVPVGEACSGYGAIRNVQIRRSVEYAKWLIATTDICIPYGEDVSLYLFELRGNTWKHRLTLESNGYQEISGAQGWLTYYVGSSDRAGRPFLITAETTPSGASVWQGLRVRVLRPGKTPARPWVLSNRQFTYDIAEGYFAITNSHGFGLIFEGNPIGADLAGWRGIHYLRGTVNGKSAAIRESAVDPSDLMANWIAGRWSQAMISVAPSARDSARKWHAIFRKERWTCGPDYVEINHQIDQGVDRLLAIASCTRDDQPHPEAYVVLTPLRGSFVITSISPTRPPIPEDLGKVTYYAGIAGLTDPVLERTVYPQLPRAVVADSSKNRKVGLSIVVNEDGSVGDVAVLDWPDVQQGIVIPAIRAVKQWKYRPGLKDGAPVSVSMNVDVKLAQ